MLVPDGGAAAVDVDVLLRKAGDVLLDPESSPEERLMHLGNIISFTWQGFSGLTAGLTL